MAPDVLGYAESVEEQTLGEETYTFLEGVRNPFSCTILIKGAHPHVISQVRSASRTAGGFLGVDARRRLPTVGKAATCVCYPAAGGSHYSACVRRDDAANPGAHLWPLHVLTRQIKEAVRDGLRAVANAVTDGFLLPGAGGIETMCHTHLMEYRKKVQGRAKLGVQAFADALLVIPKTLAENSGYDAQDSMIKLLEEQEAGTTKIGFDINTGEPLDPCEAGIWDNYRVKRQMFDSAAVISAQLLLVDEVIRAGKQMKK
eukprot:scaffold150769_cov34-Tisochrysis_lutea.AAC.4